MQVRVLLLESLFRDRQEEADASLQAAYSPRDPIAEFLRGEMTVRQLRVLASGLPTDSWFVRVSRGSEWTDDTWIGRDSNSILRVLLYTVQSAFSKVTVPKPEMLPSPLDGKTVEDDATKRYREQQRTEMDVLAGRWFANN